MIVFMTIVMYWFGLNWAHAQFGYRHQASEKVRPGRPKNESAWAQRLVRTLMFMQPAPRTRTP